MLSYKRYKQLKARRKINHAMTSDYKRSIKIVQRRKDRKTLVMCVDRLIELREEINMINELLSMHKILWKQYLSNQPKPIVTCGFCVKNCGNDFCCTVKK